MSRLLFSLALLAWTASATAQIDPVDGWIGDVNRVGVTFVYPFSAIRGGFVHFVAQPTSAEDRVALLIVGIDPATERPFPVASSSSCSNRPLVAMFPSPSGTTCLRVDRLPTSGEYLLIARPLAAPEGGNLRAHMHRYNTTLGAFDLIGDNVPIRARRITLGSSATFASGQRELRTVEIPGGLNRAFAWVERTTTGGSVEGPLVCPRRPPPVRARDLAARRQKSLRYLPTRVQRCVRLATTTGTSGSRWVRASSSGSRRHTPPTRRPTPRRSAGSA